MMMLSIDQSSMAFHFKNYCLVHTWLFMQTYPQFLANLSELDFEKALEIHPLVDQWHLAEILRQMLEKTIPKLFSEHQPLIIYSEP